MHTYIHTYYIYIYISMRDDKRWQTSKQFHVQNMFQSLCTSQLSSHKAIAFGSSWSHESHPSFGKHLGIRHFGTLFTIGAFVPFGSQPGWATELWRSTGSTAAGPCDLGRLSHANGRGPKHAANATIDHGRKNCSHLDSAQTALRRLQMFQHQVAPPRQIPPNPFAQKMMQKTHQLVALDASQQQCFVGVFLKLGREDRRQPKWLTSVITHWKANGRMKEMGLGKLS